MRSRTNVYMRPIVFPLLLLSIVLLCSSCFRKQYQTLFQQKAALADTSMKKSTDTTAEYRIQAQDVLQIRNLQNSKNIIDLNPTTGTVSNSPESMISQGETYMVENDGTVALTGLDRIKVAGLTRIEAQKYIESLYRQKFLKNPIIELKITTLKVTMLGEIRAQGNFPLIKDKTTLVEMIGQAGGLTQNANETNIKIIRGTQNKPKVTEIDLSNINSITDPNAILQNGDIIYIAQNKRAIRDNELQNFSTIFQPLILLFNTALIIFTLSHK